MKVVIVTPTYNERENIGRIIETVAGVAKELSTHDLILLVVDGNSPDGTSEYVTSLSKTYPFVHLLREKEKAGLGAAYVQGFKYGMTELNADVLVEMDGDFQHDPKDIVKFVNAIEQGADYVIGSRYVSGGRIPKEWAFYRKFLSWGGSLFSKVVLGIFSINDFTSGYKASRVKGFVDKLDLDSIMSQGFAYKIDLLFKMHKIGAKFVEVPIVFGLRDRGDSKMEKGNFMDSLKVVILLRIRDNPSFFKFLVVGLVGLGVDLGLFNVLRVTLLSSEYASAFSGFIAMLTTYILNNAWSFNDRKINSLKGKLTSLPFYILVSYIPILLRSILVKYSILYLGDTWYISNSAFFVGVLFGIAWNYTIYNKVIWRKK
ncbi:MAG: glycosyltransferase family 2 protein [Patescibacteria group bacterium]